MHASNASLSILIQAVNPSDLIVADLFVPSIKPISPKDDLSDPALIIPIHSPNLSSCELIKSYYKNIKNNSKYFNSVFFFF